MVQMVNTNGANT